MALSIEERTQRTGNSSTSTFITHIHTYLQPSSHNAIYKHTIEGKTIRPNKAGNSVQHSHLNRFYLQTAPHHANKSKKKRKDLPFVAGEPSPALSSSGRAGPPQATLRRLPSASPTNRPRRATSAGTSEGKRALNQGEREHEPRRDTHRAFWRRDREGRESIRDREPRICSPFIRRGSALRSAPFAAPPFWKLPKKGRSSLPTASHRASTNRGRAAPPRFCHTPRRNRRENSAGKLGWRILGGKSRT